MLYAAAAAIATFPAVRTFPTDLPRSEYLASSPDPLVHLWTMKWYRACLLAGRLPFLCPEIQYPVGAPLGNNPPMLLHAVGYLGLSAFLGDAACYNVLWFACLTFTGVATFLLACFVVRDARAAAIAGLVAMLSGPMMYFRTELEQMTLGSFPLFQIAWMRWVDGPTRGRLILAAGAYVLMAMSAPYFAVFGVFPAVLYLAWGFGGLGRGNRWAWLRERLPGLAGFAGLSMAGLAVAFSGQIWAALHGVPLSRPASSGFDMAVTTAWNYLLPRPPHPLCSVLPGFHDAAGVAGKIHSYLGMVTLGLVAYAAIRRVPIGRRTGYWWAITGLLLVLSLGPYLTVGTRKIGLPAHWIREYLLILRPIRVPGRFNLFVAVGRR